MNLLGVLAVFAAIGLFSLTILSLLFLAAYLIVSHGEPNE